MQPLANVAFDVSGVVTIPASATTLPTCPGDVVRHLDGVVGCRFVTVIERQG